MGLVLTGSVEGEKTSIYNLTRIAFSTRFDIKIALKIATELVSCYFFLL